MKKMILGMIVTMTMAAAVTSFASGVENCHNSANMAADNHEGKPCHAYNSNGTRCSCSSCYGNNWGNTYCTRCKHSVKSHY